MMTCAQYEDHSLAMGVETGLFSDQICTGESYSTCFAEQDRQRSSMATHSLEVQGLSDRLLCFFCSVVINKIWP